MGGNVGVQSSSIAIRGLATGEIKITEFKSRLFKELQGSLLTGAIVSLSLACIIQLVTSKTIFAVSCGIAMYSVTIFAAFIGAAIPFILKRLDLDPAIASGPFVTTSNDIIGTFIYFTIANILIFK